MVLVGVTPLAAGRGGQVGAARDDIGVGRERGAGATSQQKQGGDSGPYFLISARNFW